MADLSSKEVEQQAQRYADEWARMMTTIWRDRLSYYNIRRTGALAGSFSEDVAHDGLAANIHLQFLAYGIYQAAGVGNGYRHDNGGDLPFLGAAYRREHHLDKPHKVGSAWGGYYTSGEPRERRDWFNPKLFTSLMRMKETMAHIVGEQAAAVICEALEDSRKALAR